MAKETKGKKELPLSQQLLNSAKEAVQQSIKMKKGALKVAGIEKWTAKQMEGVFKKAQVKTAKVLKEITKK